MILFLVSLHLSFAGLAQDKKQDISRDSLIHPRFITPRSLLKADTLLLWRYNQLVFQDSCINIPIVFMPDSLIRDSLHYEYQTIKRLAYKNSWMTELYKLVFVDPRPNRLNVMRVENSENRFIRYRNKIINSISVKILPPYGYSVYDTLYEQKELDRIRKWANATHVSSSEFIIRRQLTLKPGMRVNPFDLVQNELIIRKLDNVDDVNIMLQIDERDSMFVNLSVICKDQYSWGAELESNFLNSFKVEVENRNFMGLGHQIKYQFSFKGNKEKQWGNYLNYVAHNMFGTHIDGEIGYRNDTYEKYFFSKIERPMLTNQLNWGGGMKFSRIFYSEYLPDRHVEKLDTLFNYNSHDIWIGHAFEINPKFGYNRNFYITSRFYSTIFKQRPPVSILDNQLYYNRYTYLCALTFRAIKYYKANLIYDFGRTEIIPSGFFSTLVGGVESNEYDNLGYIGGQGIWSYFSNRTERYYFISASYGTHLNRKKMERGILQIRTGHISNLCSWGDYKFRFHGHLDYTKGVNRYPDDYLYLGEYNIHGFESDTLKGKERISVSLGTTLFFPFIKKGFRASLTSFVDFGTIGQQNKSVLHSQLYWGIGATLALRNDNLIFKNIAISLIYYPSKPSDVNHFKMIMSGRRKDQFIDFEVREPKRIQFE